jgi:hypothetical protein
MIAYGQPLADHATIGSAAHASGAHQDSVRAFHAAGIARKTRRSSCRAMPIRA